MKVHIQKSALRRLLRSGQWTLGLGALALLSYTAILWAGGRIYQNAERHRFDELLAVPAPPGPGAPSAVLAGGMIGRLDVPRLGISVMVAEGVDDRTLDRAAGHIPGTARPGDPGNTAISAHRDTFFRPLRNVRAGDLVNVATLAGEYEYSVVSTQITKPSDVSVLAQDGPEVLTLVTCYPFYYIGAAPDRFIVRARRVR